MRKIIIYVLLLASFQTYAQDTKVTITGGATGGTVTNIATGYGLTGGPITTTGTIKVDTSLLLTKLLAASLYQPLLTAGTNITIVGNTINASGSGTVTTVTGTSPIVITSTPTTTPNVTITAMDATHAGYVAAGGSASKILHGDGTWKDTTSVSTPNLQQVTTVGNITTTAINALRYNANTSTYTTDTIMTYGDSKTLLTTLPAWQYSNGWPSTICATFGKVLVNNGVNGATISTLLSSLATIPTKRTGVVGLTFWYGQNDVAASTSAASFITTYRRIMDTCLARGYSAGNLYILFGTDPGMASQALAQAYHDSIASMCNITGIQFLDFFDLTKTYTNTGVNIWIDDIHENIYGQNVISSFIVQRMKGMTIKDSAQTDAIIANGIIDGDRIRIRKGDSTIYAQDLKNSSILGATRYGSVIKLNATSYVQNQNLDSIATPQNINITGDLRAGLVAVTDNPFTGGGRHYATAKPATVVGFVSTSTGGFIGATNSIATVNYPMHISDNAATIIGSIGASSDGNTLQVIGSADVATFLTLRANTQTNATGTLNIAPATFTQNLLSGRDGYLIQEMPITIFDQNSSGGTKPFMSVNTLTGSTLNTTGRLTTYSVATTLFIRSKPVGGDSVIITKSWGIYDSSSAHFGDTVQIQDGTQGAGKVFTSDASGNGSWQNPSYVAKTGTYTATASDYTIDCTANTFTVTLPTAVGISGKIYVIKNSGAGTITVGTTSSQTIDGVTTQTLSTQYSSYTIQSNNANWIIL